VLSATDESQGGWAEHFGGVIGRVLGREGLRSPSCELGAAREAISARFLPEFAQEGSSPVWSTSSPAV